MTRQTLSTCRPATWRVEELRISHWLLEITKSVPVGGARDINSGIFNPYAIDKSKQSEQHCDIHHVALLLQTNIPTKSSVPPNLLECQGPTH